LTIYSLASSYISLFGNMTMANILCYGKILPEERSPTQVSFDKNSEMKALKFISKENLQLVDVPEPEPGSRQVKIKVKQAGICGTDLHQYTDGPIGLLRRPIPIAEKVIRHITLGHEFSGEITKIAPDISEFQPGDRVAVQPLIPCGQCKYCREGKPSLCSDVVFLGLNDDGAFAEYIVAPVNTINKLPDSMSYEQAAFCEPLAVSVHGVRMGKVSLGSTVAITGAGTIGLLAMQAALAAGASKVFIIEPIAKRRDLALRLGASAVFNPLQDDVSKEIAKLTGGIRADVTIEAAGSQNAMLITTGTTARGGIIVQLGVMEGSCDFPFAQLWGREQTISPSAAYDIDFPIALDLLARQKVIVDPLISSKISLETIIDKGFRELSGPNRSDYIKILVSP